MYALGYRPGSIERLAIGAKEDGTLDAMTQEAIAMTSQFELFARNDATWSGTLYQCPNAKYAHKLVRLDLATPCDMRAPGAATGVYGLECAMDELAVALKLDPLEFRYRNYSDRDQNQDLPFTSKNLRECYRQGAEAFGWSKRDPKPRSMRDGGELVGWGMATGVWEALQMKTSARIALTVDGRAEVASATSDIGTGTYTIMAQVAADMLGLPIERHQHQTRRLHAAAIAGRRRIVDRGFGRQCDRETCDKVRERCGRPGDAEFAAGGGEARRRPAAGRTIVDKTGRGRECLHRQCDACTAGWIRIEQERSPVSRPTQSTPATPIRRFSPR